MGTLGKMALTVIMLVSLLISQLSYAETYKWVDEKGTVHFTEDPATIPEKYWDKAKSRTTEEDLMTPEEKIRAKQKYEEEVREQLKREKGEYDAKELEKRVKEIMEKTQKQRGGCEIVSYSQYGVIMDIYGRGGGGYISRGDGHIDEVNIHAIKNTCVDLVIKNNDREPKTITEQNIIATTSKGVVTRHGSSTPAETKNKFNPKAVFIQIGPGETYRGSICFDRQLPIAKLELQGL
jgi:hypothetical protein